MITFAEAQIERAVPEEAAAIAPTLRQIRNAIRAEIYPELTGLERDEVMQHIRSRPSQPDDVSREANGTNEDITAQLFRTQDDLEPSIVEREERAPQSRDQNATSFPADDRAFQERIANNGTTEPIFVAKLGDTVLGMAGLELHGSHVTVTEMYVQEEARGADIGRRLIERVIDEYGDWTLEVKVGSKLSDAQAFYEKFDFTQTDQPTDHIELSGGHAIDMITMVRPAGGLPVAA